jgi:hypothetical protein
VYNFHISSEISYLLKDSPVKIVLFISVEMEKHKKKRLVLVLELGLE